MDELIFTTTRFWVGILLCATFVTFVSPAFAQDNLGLDSEPKDEPEKTPERVDAPLPKGVAANPGDVITEFGVRGTRRVEPDSVLGQLRLKVGDKIDLDVVSDDIRRIYRLGYFEDIQVDATKTNDGRVVVTFIVKEKPAIVTISSCSPKRARAPGS